MANYYSKPISQLENKESVKDNDSFAFVDPDDKTQSSSGSTFKTTIGVLKANVKDSVSGSSKTTCKVAVTEPLTASYFNGDNNDGVGATLINNGAYIPLSIDGVDLEVGDRVLVHYQSNSIQNGIYDVLEVGTTLLPWRLIRSTDYDGSLNGKIRQGDVIGVVLGADNNLTIWFQVSEDPTSIGDDPINFSPTVDATSFWIQVNTLTHLMVSNSGYLANMVYPNQVNLTLPSTPEVGDIIEVQGTATGLWRISQPDNHKVFFNDLETSLGASGYIESTSQRGGLSLVCSYASESPPSYEWTVTGSIGLYFTVV